uniref:Uncharacterized protein n=1 Tax=Arundo donax TaxID=35708 RepID=A0A0A9GMG1_ARUDO
MLTAIVSSFRTCLAEM